MTRLPDGFRIGHATDSGALTGCTVILCPPRTVGGCDIRGSSPGSRETALLDPLMSMQEVHAVLLTGGSAFGLSAADGVVRWLEEQGTGYQTPWARVPIVPAAVVFDLNIGSASVRPGPADGYAACRAVTESSSEGNIGAGTGATVGKWGGMETCMKGGLGVASAARDGVQLCAVAVVNAVGDVLDSDGSVLAGARSPSGGWLADADPLRTIARPGLPLQTNTTLVALLAGCPLSKVDAARLARRGHDGIARAIRPAHTSYDGDLIFTLAAGPAPALPLDLLAEMAAELTAEAIRRGVRYAAPAGGVPSLGPLV